MCALCPTPMWAWLLVTPSLGAQSTWVGHPMRKLGPPAHSHLCHSAPHLPLCPQFRNPKASLRVRLCDLLGHLQRSSERDCQEFYRALYIHAQLLHSHLPSRLAPRKPPTTSSTRGKSGQCRALCVSLCPLSPFVSVPQSPCPYLLSLFSLCKFSHKTSISVTSTPYALMGLAHTVGGLSLE